MWQMSNDRQLPAGDDETLALVGIRNRLRTQFGLPPVELERELDRIHHFRERQEFDRWMKSPLRYRVEQKLLQRLRRRLGNPRWTPTGVLSGGGWAFHVALVRQMRRLRDRLGERAKR
jgi:hypothetical protein